MKRTSFLAAIPMCAGLIFAQTTGSEANQNQNDNATTTPRQTGTNNEMHSASGQSWTGTLVASGCNTSTMHGAYDMNRTTNDTAGHMRTSSYAPSSYPQGSLPEGSPPRGTTPTSDMNRKTVGDHDVNNPQTGMADRNRGADTNTYGSKNSDWQTADRAGGANQDWESGAKNTSGWDRACFISPSTSSFVFLTKDGREVQLDSESNSLIQQRLQSTNRVSEKSKIFRVRVHGTMSGDTLHVNDIKI